MSARRSTTYRDVGVLNNTELGLDALLKSVIPTGAFRQGKIGQNVLDIGYFANVIDMGHGIGLAMTTDGVGTKILVAELLNKYDTIGIDCVAMNVNDLICVGAEPVSMLDYIAIEKATPEVLEAIGRGLYEGARQAGVSIVGGEIAQIGNMIRGTRESGGLDLAGMCIGVVPISEVNVGQSVIPGDIIVGFGSSGIHCNGLTLAREVLLSKHGYSVDTFVPEFGCTAGEELLRPTSIYVSLAAQLRNRHLPIRAFVNITSDGFLNLTRIRPEVSFRIDSLPTPQPVFAKIQQLGSVSDAEMYRVFNMGVGFCVIVPDDRAIVQSVHELARAADFESFEIGKVIADPSRRVLIPQKNLVGQGEYFEETK
jgi:phosphoribosylformylglycinamidine cyclo-ligase